MNKKEYEARRAEIYDELAKLTRQYIEDNTDIEPGSVVIAAGQKCYLKDWKVVTGDIYPILHKMKRDGTMHTHERIHVSKNAKIVKV